MRAIDHINRVGHLFALIRREEPSSNFSFFFPLDGLSQWERLERVTAGILDIAREHEENYEIQTFSIADIGRVREDFPDVNEARVWRVDIESWIDEQGEFCRELAAWVIGWRLRFPADHLPDISPGKIVKDADFFNQEESIDSIWGLIQAGKNILLAAPRRFGKSSLINHLVDHVRDGVKACYVDLEGGDSAPDFINRILKGLMDNHRCHDCLPFDIKEQLTSGALEGYKRKIIQAQTGEIRSWKEYGRRLFEGMNRANGRFLLILDEFSWLLEDMISRLGPDVQEVKELLDWLSEAFREYEHLSFIITGSEHLDLYLEANKITTDPFRQLERVHLEPFSRETAERYSFLALFKQDIAVTPADLKTIIDLIGRPIPYFLQVYLDLLQSECHRTEQLGADKFQDIYFTRLLGPEAKRYFEYIDHQIERYARYGVDMGSLKRILAELSRTEKIAGKDLAALYGSPAPDGRPFNFLLVLLQNDFLLNEQDGYFSLECKIFRDYFAARAF